MILAVLLMSLALLGVALATQRYGYRLGGTITVGVLAVYTLKNVVMLPVFVLSTLVAYIGLSVLKQQTLIYGRAELVASIVVGSVIPLFALLGLSTITDSELRQVVFIGSILPGLAAYNYHQLKPRYRLPDLMAAAALYVSLVVLGWMLVTPETARTIGAVTPPVLFAGTADVAVYRGAVVPGSTVPGTISRTVLVALLLLGMGLAELVRSRFGVRVGMISLPLLAVYALVDVWLVVLFVVVSAASFLFIQTVHRYTLLYGRVLIGLGTSFAVVLVVPLTIATPVHRGLSAFFIGILAGVNAYNRHVTPRPDRLARMALAVAVFLLLVVVTLVSSDPFPGALVTGLTPTRGFILLAGSVAAASLALRRHAGPPTDDEVFHDSALRGGEGS